MKLSIAPVVWFSDLLATLWVGSGAVLKMPFAAWTRRTPSVTLVCKNFPGSRKCEWLPRKDSNLDKEIQNLWCYHYTTRQAECSEDLKLSSFFPQEASKRSKFGAKALPRRQPDLGAFLRSLHFKRQAAFHHKQPGPLQHVVDHLVVVAGIVVKQNQFPDLGLQSD